MRTAAIICEYNPFHNGHLYQIKEIKRHKKPDYIIAVMSGNFVQRGTPAFCDKYARTRFALEHGIDLVFELPVRYAASSASFFASGAVSLLDSLNCIDDLVFGTETTNFDYLERYACLFSDETPAFKKELQTCLKQGLSYASARQKAADNILAIHDHETFFQPNNILAVEYLTALNKCNSSIRPYAIKRMKSEYHATAIQSNISSATAIRNHLMQYGFDDIVAASVPKAVRLYFEKYKPQSLTFNDFSDMIYYAIMTEQHPDLYLDYHPDLMNRIYNQYENHALAGSLISAVKTKSFTYARINRYLLHLMLKITLEQASAPCGYGKILGIRKDASKLLKIIRQNASIPIIQKTAHYKEFLSDDSLISFEQDLIASNIYRYALQKKYGLILPSDLHYPLIIV